VSAIPAREGRAIVDPEPAAVFLEEFQVARARLSGTEKSAIEQAMHERLGISKHRIQDD